MYVLIVIIVFIALGLGCIHLERKIKDKDIKFKSRIALYSALVFSSFLLLYALPYSNMACGVEVVDDTIKIYHVGCGLGFLGMVCTYSFKKQDILGVKVINWSVTNYCKPKARLFGISISNYLSGWFDTTCGKALIQSISDANIIIELKNVDFKVILGPRLEQLNTLVSIIS